MERELAGADQDLGGIPMAALGELAELGSGRLLWHGPMVDSPICCPRTSVADPRTRSTR